MKVSKALHGAFASLYQVMVSKEISAVEPLAKCEGSEGARNSTEFLAPVPRIQRVRQRLSSVRTGEALS